MSSMMPRRSASPSVAMPRSAPDSTTALRRVVTVPSVGEGMRPPNRGSWRSWMTSTWQRAVSRIVCRLVSETPNIGSSTMCMWAWRMVSVSSLSMMASRYQLMERWMVTQLAGAGLMGLDAAHVRIRQALQGGGELVGDRLVGVAATGQEDLDAVVQGRVVGGGHGHPVGGPQAAHRPHGGGGRGGAVDEGDPDAVADEHLNGPPGGGIGQEAAVVADDDTLLGRALLQDAVGQPLGQEPDIGAGELIADHGSPAAGAEVDHGGSSAEAPLPGTGRRGG